MKLKDLQNRDFAEVMLGKTLAKIYKLGPVDATDYEILSYISIFRQERCEGCHGREFIH